MRRCKDIQGGGLILAVCLCAGVALADIWPSWLSPAQGSYDRGNQAMSGAVERLTVSVGPQAWTNYITTNIWAGYFSQASKLKASKNMFKAALNGATWVRPVTNYTPEISETVTESNILAWCGAPAGWWTNHPYGNIANSSNGWRFLPDVASNLVWASSTAGGVTNVWGSQAFSDLSTNVQTAFDSIDGSDFSTPIPATAVEDMPMALVEGLYDDGDYQFSCIRMTGSVYVIAGNALTNTAATSLIYVKTGKALYFGYVDSQFSTQGDAITNIYTLTATWDRAAGVRISPFYGSDLFGQGSITNKPVEYIDPIVSYPSEIGWQFDGVHTVHKYNVTTNGFKWFR
jgi:hypothetical protein